MIGSPMLLWSSHSWLGKGSRRRDKVMLVIFETPIAFCHNNLLAILDFTGRAKQLDEMAVKIIAGDDVGLA